MQYAVKCYCCTNLGDPLSVMVAARFTFTFTSFVILSCGPTKTCVRRELWFTMYVVVYYTVG